MEPLIVGTLEEAQRLADRFASEGSAGWEVVQLSPEQFDIRPVPYPSEGDKWNFGPDYVYAVKGSGASKF